MKDLGNLLKQAQDMQAKMAAFQEDLTKIELEGSAGGGVVRVTLSGKGALVRLAIDPSLMKPEEREILEDLIVAAHADARSRVDQHMSNEMGKFTSGLGLPPGLKLPGF